MTVELLFIYAYKKQDCRNQFKFAQICSNNEINLITFRQIQQHDYLVHHICWLLNKRNNYIVHLKSIGKPSE